MGEERPGGSIGEERKLPRKDKIPRFIGWGDY